MRKTVDSEQATGNSSAGRALGGAATASGSASVLPRIWFLRGQRVMLSTELAPLYGVRVKALVQAVKRNPKRFPPDFLFQVNGGELASLRSQLVTIENGLYRARASSSRGRHSKYRPYAFTEHGVAMLSCVLRSDRAIEVSIEIIRVFVRLRSLLATNRDLARRVAALEKRTSVHGAQLTQVFEAIGRMIRPEALPRRRIGFAAGEPR